MSSKSLKPDDAYDLVLVIMRKNHALQILPVLAANQHTPNVLFLCNNAAGPGAFVEALGKERVLIGFPNSAGYREGHVIHCLSGTPDDKANVPFGEVDGRITDRTRTIARILESAPGFGAEIRTDMDAWLKYHVALLFPSLAPALHAAGVDNYRLARTRDLVVLGIRAIREGFRVLAIVGAARHAVQIEDVQVAARTGLGSTGAAPLGQSAHGNGAGETCRGSP